MDIQIRNYNHGGRVLIGEFRVDLGLENCGENKG